VRIAPERSIAWREARASPWKTFLLPHQPFDEITLSAKAPGRLGAARLFYDGKYVFLEKRFTALLLNSEGTPAEIAGNRLDFIRVISMSSL
jgi:hypothetical protein